LPNGPENDHFCDGGGDFLPSANSSPRRPERSPSTPSASPCFRSFASTSSAIEFGTGRGFSIRLSSGSMIRK
jgi:hypothetical protein